MTNLQESAPVEISEPATLSLALPITLLTNVKRLQQTYEKNAENAEKSFLRLRILILFLTTLAAVLSIADSQLNTFISTQAENFYLKQLGEIARYCLIIVPISTSVLLAGSIKLDKGSNWLLLKGAAATLQKEIYYFRTKTEKYKLDPSEQQPESPEQKLVKEVEKIHNGFQGTPVHKACFNPYENELQPKDFNDKSFESMPAGETLDAETYIRERVEKQFNEYRSRAKRLSTQLEISRWIIYILGGVSTLLATTKHLQIWVAVSSTLVGSITSYLELKRMETALINYNQAADVLYRIRLFWDSLTDEEKSKPENLDKLVKDAETVIQNENNTLLQDMQNLLQQQTSPKS